MSNINQNRSIKKYVRSHLLWLFIALIPSVIFAQKTDTIYTPQGKLYQIVTTKGTQKTIQTFGYSGKLERLETFSNDKLEGLYQEYYANGNLKIEANYKKGQLNGNYKAYRQDGKLQSEEQHKQFTIDGSREALKHGLAKHYHYNGNLMSEGTFEKGKMEGNWTFYNQQGWMSEQKVFKEGKMAGTHIQYYENGQIQYKADVFEDITIDGIHHNKMVNGWLRRYFKNGNPEEATELINGELSGNQKRWKENGRLSFEAVMDGEKRISHYYDSNGALTLYLEEKKIYKNGYLKWQKHGIEKWYKEGALTSEKTYKDGEAEGSFKQYSTNGVLIGEGQTHKGKMIGTYKTYFENGQLKSTQRKEYVVQWQGDTAIVDDGWYRRYFEDGKVDYESYTDMGQEVYNAQYDKRGALLKRTYKIQNIDWSQEYYPRGIIKSDLMNGDYYHQKAVWFITGQPQTINASSYYPLEQSFFYAFDGSGNLLKPNIEDRNHPNLQSPSEDHYFNQNEDFYQAKVADGTYRLTYQNGQTRIETSIKDGLPNGATSIFRPDGSLALYVETENGLSRGLSYYLSPQGDTIMRQMRGAGKELKRKLWSSDSSYNVDVYNEGGTRLYHYETYPGGSPEILEDNIKKINKRWNPDGKITSESEVVEGKSGLILHKDYHPNGKLRNEYTYRGTKNEGDYRLYHENGQLFVETSYKSGKQDGDYKRYDEQGDLFSSGRVVEGKKEGIWLVRMDGKMVERLYKNDKLQVSLPQEACACLDTSLASGSLSYVPRFKDVLSYRQYKNRHPSFINPLSEEQYGKLFYRRLYESGADIIAFRPLTFTLGRYAQNTLTINRCHTNGYVSVLPFNYITNGSSWLSLSDPKFELSFATGVMHQHGDKNIVHVYTEAANAEFSEKHYIKTKDTYLEACFEPIRRRFWQLNEAKVAMLPNVKTTDALDLFGYQELSLNELKGFPETFKQEQEVEIKNPMAGVSNKMVQEVFTETFLKQRLIGFVAVQGKGVWVLSQQQLAFDLRYLWLTEDWAAGSFDLPLMETAEEERVSLKTINGKSVESSLEEIKRAFLEQEGFDYVDVQPYKGQNKIKVTFWVN